MALLPGPCSSDSSGSLPQTAPDLVAVRRPLSEAGEGKSGVKERVDASFEPAHQRGVFAVPWGGGETTAPFLDPEQQTADAWGEPSNCVIRRAIALSVRMQKRLQKFNVEHNLPLRLSVGITHGAVTAGVFGRKHFTFDVREFILATALIIFWG
jgi:class 3 adenylate cyclase